MAKRKWYNRYRRKKPKQIDIGGGVMVDWASVDKLNKALDEIIFKPPPNGIERAMEEIEKRGR